MLLTGVPSYGKKEKKSPTETFALVAGTVFRPPGFALPGAEVTVTPVGSTASGEKLRSVKAITGARGEFAVRVPPVPSKYEVDVKMKGFQGQHKPVSIEGEQRFDLSFVLEPEGRTK